MENDISILVIEDETLIAHSLKLLLEDFGYRVPLVCYSYETALEAVETAEYDLAISDINLGRGTTERSGLTLMSYVREVKKRPFIFLTASGDKETVKEAAACLPSAYLVKPINEANLHVAIQLGIENFRNIASAAGRTTDDNPEPDFFYVKIGSRMKKIMWRDVDYMEAIKNYVKIFTPENKSGVLVRGSLQQVYNSMVPPGLKNIFIRISRSVIFAKRHITEIGEGFIVTPFGRTDCSADIDPDIFKDINR